MSADLNRIRRFRMIDENKFEALENGLYKCKECGSTFENENECKEHYLDLEV